MSFEGKSVVVMGAGAGMGQATAKEYGRRGAKVVVADIDAPAANRVVDAIRSEGGTAEAHEMDLRKREDVFGTIDAAVELFGGLDILANVGAVYPNASVDQMSEEVLGRRVGCRSEGSVVCVSGGRAASQEVRRGDCQRVVGRRVLCDPGACGL